MAYRSTHITANGDSIAIKDMSDQHLIATIRVLEDRAGAGLKIMTGGMGLGDDEPWYDEDVVYSDEALDVMGYDAYYDEAVRRSLNHIPRFKPKNRGTYEDNPDYAAPPKLKF